MKIDRNFPQRNNDFILRKEGEEGILFNPKTGAFPTLNATACFIWELLDGNNSKEKIADEIVKEYSIPKETAVKDLNEFLLDSREGGIVLGPPPARDICFAVTGRCNLRCKHCCAKDSWGTEDFSTEELLDIISQMAEAGAKSVALFGGEPLMREDIFTLIDKLKEHSITPSVNTNAALVTEEIAKKFKEKGITSFCVSLDGASSEVHEQQRGKGSFDETTKGIKNLVAQDLSVLLSFTVTKINEKDIEKMVELGRELKVGQVRYNHVFYGGNALCFIEEILIKPTEELKICERVFKLQAKYGDFITGSYLQQYEKLKKAGKVEPEKGKITVPVCGAANGKCAIRPDGWVTPCEVIWEVKAGNLKQEKFIDIWEDSKVMNDFREVKYIDLEDMPQCRDCEYQFECFQGHRCYPYHYPNGIKDTRLYCFKYNEAPVPAPK